MADSFAKVGPNTPGSSWQFCFFVPSGQFPLYRWHSVLHYTLIQGCISIVWGWHLSLAGIANNKISDAWFPLKKAQNESLKIDSMYMRGARENLLCWEQEIHMEHGKYMPNKHYNLSNEHLWGPGMKCRCRVLGYQVSEAFYHDDNDSNYGSIWTPSNWQPSKMNIGKMRPWHAQNTTRTHRGTKNGIHGSYESTQRLFGFVNMHAGLR